MEAAMARAAELRARSARKVRVRILPGDLDGEPGLVIRANIAARHTAELEAQEGKGVRLVRWAELDARAADLIAVVEEVVAEIEAAIASAPSATPRPSKTETDFDEDAYEALTTSIYEGMAKASLAMRDGPAGRGLSSAMVLEASMCGALKMAALAAVAVGLDEREVQQELKLAMGDLLSATPKIPAESRRFDA
jgi:hypothetical protein